MYSDCHLLYVIWYHLCNLKNVKNTHGGVLLLVKLQTEACNATKSNTLPLVFLTFFKLYKGTKPRQASNIQLVVSCFPTLATSYTFIKVVHRALRNA